MIDQKKINNLICALIKEETGVEVVKSNSTANKPAYPYISFTLTNIGVKKGTYSKDGVLYKPLVETISYTVQSDDDNEALNIAMQLHDFFEQDHNLGLNDNGIVVQEVGGISNRDNMLTIEYEYRKGFDVVLSLVNVLEDTAAEVGGEIDNIEF